MRSDKTNIKQKNKKKPEKIRNKKQNIPTSSRKVLSTKRKSSKLKHILIGIALVCLLGLISYAAYFAISANKAVESIQGDSIESTSAHPRPKPVALEKKEPFSVLLLGVDERPEDSGRSDSILVATVNPEKNSVKLISIPRDTLVNIPEHGNDKINAAFAYGGVNLAVQTVENFLNIPINYYAKINMQGMIGLVDAVGGINVDNKYAFDLDGVQLEVGNYDLSGREALQYARMRYQDPAGDFGRQLRQKEVINKIVQKSLSINSLANFNDIFSAVGDNVQTSFTGSELWELAKNYASTAKNIENLTLEGPDGYKYYIPSYGQDVYIWQPSPDSLQDISNQLREHLGLTAETITTIEIVIPSSSSSIEQQSTYSKEYYQEPESSYEPYVAPKQEPTWSAPANADTSEPDSTITDPIVPSEPPSISDSTTKVPETDTSTVESAPITN
ncbi:LCP family glycopolymer transferase [Carnobacterium gallinarum]|uniref:LCP family glycopolymer transferase n=1 Tax=Carnobacterium gallinarum TaxID=2749 RepID=UPI000690ED6D|nr:LCP family protein [Carnobacterium gallinarum]